MSKNEDADFVDIINYSISDVKAVLDTYTAEEGFYIFRTSPNEIIDKFKSVINPETLILLDKFNNDPVWVDLEKVRALQADIILKLSKFEKIE